MRQRGVPSNWWKRGFGMALLGIAASATIASAAQREFDVIVYGETAGAAIAAIAAANEGCSVALVVPEKNILAGTIEVRGGDEFAGKELIGGLSREFFERAAKQSGAPLSWEFDPKTAPQVFRSWLQEAGVEVFTGQRAARVAKQGVHLASFTTYLDNTFAARVFVDASYSGDLLPLAGVAPEPPVGESFPLAGGAPKPQAGGTAPIRFPVCLTGEHRLTLRDVWTSTPTLDSIGMGLAPSPEKLAPTRPFQIPYRALTPKAAVCENLLAAFCVSADPIVAWQIHEDPVEMVLGHSAGVAAAWAAQYRAPVQQVNYTLLRKRLRLQGQILEVPGQERNRAAALGFPGIVIDNPQAQLTGNWLSSSSVKPFVGSDYLHDNNTDKGAKAARFIPFLPADGMYEVRISCAPGGNRASNVPVTINAADGIQKATVNQKKPPKTPPFTPLGKFQFKAGADGWVEIGTAGTDGHVIADAVQWVAMKP